MGDRPGDMWLEPCVGSGVFLEVLEDLGVGPRRVLALDLDPSPERNDRLARTMRGVDFIAWSQVTKQRFDKIIGNPPYVALESLHADLQKPVLSLKAPGGTSVTIGANYWYAFVCAGLSLLRPNGSICFVLPAAWDYADYAAPLRSSLSRLFEVLEIHRSSTPLFDTVRDGSVVMLGRRFRATPVRTIRVQHASLYSLSTRLASNPAASHRKVPPPLTNAVARFGGDTCNLGDILEIHIGGVTGDSNYFLLTDAQRRTLELPRAALRPVVSRARHLVTAQLGKSEWEMLLDRGERVWLFDPPRRLLSHKAVKRYIRLKSPAGGCNRQRYKISSRSPWYRTPLEARIDGFISGMSERGPWLCLRGMPRLNATNTLYVVRFRETMSRDWKAAWALSMLTSSTRNSMVKLGRKYPDGLVKYEPSDLVKLSLPVPRVARGVWREYSHAVEALLGGDVGRCEEIANRWMTNTGERKHQ
jgi:hypothetical protein